MHLNEYQKWSRQTAIYPEKQALEYLALGLVSEAGEVAGKVKKLIRDNKFDKEATVKEIGDVFWYLARMCDHLGINCEDVLQQNYEKLSDRASRGVLSGSGDNR